MAVTIEVDYRVLQRSGAAWSTAATTLAGVGARLGLVSGAGLAPLVAAEVDAFVQRWGQEVRALTATADSGRAAFALVGGDYRITDAHLAEEIRSLMPWCQRHDAIRGA